GVILPSAASRYEIASHRIVPVSELQSVARRKPIGEPSLYGTAISAHGIAYQIAVTLVQIGIVKFVVRIAAEIATAALIVRTYESAGRFGRHALHMKVEFGD